MRYRSATVADSHGLPLNLERNKRTTDPRRLRELTPSVQPFCLGVSCQKAGTCQRSPTARHFCRNAFGLRLRTAKSPKEIFA